LSTLLRPIPSTWIQRLDMICTQLEAWSSGSTADLQLRITACALRQCDVNVVVDELHELATANATPRKIRKLIVALIGRNIDSWIIRPRVHGPDGSRRRRFSPNPSRRRWYASHRAARFAARIWGTRK
jgi:hypothetical protein